MSTVLSREEIAQIEVGHTTISRSTTLGLCAAFLTLISVPAIVDLVAAARHADNASQAWSTLAALPTQVRGAVAAHEMSTDATLRSRFLGYVIAGNRAILGGLRSFEDELADGSPVFAALRPSAQAALSGWLAAGNERVFQGRDGWLFYRPDVEYVVGIGFLDPADMRRRLESSREWTDQPQPDPRAALVQFKRQLDERGIALIVVPTPVKPAMHPEKLSRRVDSPVPVQNPSYSTFLEDLRRSGVTVFDLGHELARNGGPTEYLATDTHWRPPTMERAAELLGAFIRSHVAFGDSPHDRHQIDAREVTNVGDTATMLDLGEGHALTRPETVTIHRVLGSDGSPWQPSRDADVLVLGDSFSNIYSLASMGWGDGAGLVEHLARALERPVDRIVQNDNGAFATRARLRQDLASGSDRLRGKRVVVLQFAARELRGGDWKLIDLPAPEAP